MNNEHLREDINALFDYIVSVDARLMATHMALTRILMKDEEKKEAFEAELEENYQACYLAMKETVKTK